MLSARAVSSQYPKKGIKFKNKNSLESSLIRCPNQFRRVPPAIGPFLPSLVALGALHEIYFKVILHEN